MNPLAWVIAVLAATGLVAVVTAVARHARRELARVRTLYAEQDEAVNLACGHCVHGGGIFTRCSCVSDCGEPVCNWEFEAVIAGILEREGGTR